MANTPNMDLALPVVNTTLGPAYAQLNNEAFEAIDTHDHTIGNGVLIPAAGIGIDADLQFNGFSATELEAATFGDVAGTPADRSVYVDGGDLYFKDGDGTAIPLTVAGFIAGTPGSISNLAAPASAVYSDIALDFTWFYDSVDSKIAAMNMGNIRLYPFDGVAAYTNFVTLKSPTTLATDYTLTLPGDVPALTSLVQVSATGVLTFSNTPVNPILANLGAVGAPTYSFTGDTNTGIYSTGADSIDFATVGVRTAALQAGGLYLILGTAALPSFAFIGDTNTGMWASAADTLNWSTAGVERLELDATSMNLTVPFVGTTGTFSGAVSGTTGTFSGAVSGTTGTFTGAVSGTTGTFTSTVEGASLKSTSGTAFKVKAVSTGTASGIADTAGNTRSAAHGLTVGNFVGLSCAITLSSGFTYGPGMASSGTSAEVLVYADATNVYIRYVNQSGGVLNITQSYVTIVYL